MKTKTKMIASLEIAIVLCSLFLVALPGIAAEQNQTTQKVSASEVTTASEDDYVLGIYGNANEDDTIDMGDVVYTKLAIFGKKPKTELCDAKYDGRINVLDVIQTKLIILGKEKELTVIDSYEKKIVTVKKPIKRVVVPMRFVLEPLRALKVSKDTIVGVQSYISEGKYGDKIFFAEFKGVPSVGMLWNPDVEAILNLNPDLVFLTPASRLDAITDTLKSAGIPVLHFYAYVGLEGGFECYPEEITKLGYIFDKRIEAEEFREWFEGVVNPTIEKAENIPEEDRPKVYYESHKPYSSYRKPMACVEIAGGKNIFPAGGAIDPEAVIAQNPDIIIKKAPTTEGVAGYDVDDTIELEKIREEIMGRSELQNVAAVKTGKVYILSGYLTAGGGRSGPRGFIGILYNAKWFHPELFEDLDPKANHQEYLTFQGLDKIDLDNQGVFVYHPEQHPDGH